MKTDKPLIILSGPTAVGKTALSVEFALMHDLEIISADSAQVYKGMDIGTAKITEEEKRGVRHHLIDVCDPSEDYSAFRFKEMADAAIEDIYSRGKIPLIVGGTGFYIQALLKGVSFDDEGPDEEYRNTLMQLCIEKGNDYLHSMLEDIDPESAEKIPEGNVKRMIRALEYHHLTGRKISDHNLEEAAKGPVYDAAYFVLTDERSLIYERIDKRVTVMIESGLEDEVRNLLGTGLDPSCVSMQAIGYKEMIPYINGQATLAEAADEIRLRTRHFAKRQLTWYKREPDVIYIDRQKFDGRTSDMCTFMTDECRKRGIL
ncbi:MAG: tRNA (adenosine(37)-N6)-dimethylallyltransferase MiaA [Lachnospiraceae bacterium]|nr:tRNA (adenosine(37)-N6)-dimethylallyltransferase MiaA [Lachnospiraceae bacterium]